MKEKLEITANIAAILTPIAGLCLWGLYRCKLFRKKKKLEAYLKEQRETAEIGDRGQRSLLHVMTYVGLTESEALQLSFDSDCIGRFIKADGMGFADRILFQYVLRDDE